ncbi:MAG: BT_3928 family protein, partial [Bacteroidia bacterium]
DIFLVEFFQQLKPYALLLAIFLVVFEIILGVALLIGFLPKLTTLSLLIVIVLFTFLTWYSATYDKVTDCGCFGDAIPLTPWGSFTKDIILLVFIIILIIGEKYIKPILSSKTTNYITIGGTALSLIFPIYTYTYLPVKDFRPYKIGADIEKGMETIRQPVVEMIFVYEKNGEQIELTTDQLATVEDLGSYTFIERKDKVIDPGEPAPIHDFILNDETGMDVTNVFIDYDGYKLLTVQYDLDKTDLAAQPLLEALASTLEEQGIKCYHVSAGSKSQIESLNTTLSYYTVDKTTLKTIVRSNPGLVLFKDNVIAMKWPSTRFPSIDEVMSYVK